MSKAASANAAKVKAQFPDKQEVSIEQGRVGQRGREAAPETAKEIECPLSKAASANAALPQIPAVRLQRVSIEQGRVGQRGGYAPLWCEVVVGCPLSKAASANAATTGRCIRSRYIRVH